MELKIQNPIAKIAISLLFSGFLLFAFTVLFLRVTELSTVMFLTGAISMLTSLLLGIHGNKNHSLAISYHDCGFVISYFILTETKLHRIPIFDLFWVFCKDLIRIQIDLGRYTFSTEYRSADEMGPTKDWHHFSFAPFHLWWFDISWWKFSTKDRRYSINLSTFWDIYSWNNTNRKLERMTEDFPETKNPKRSHENIDRRICFLDDRDETLYPSESIK